MLSTVISFCCAYGVRIIILILQITNTITVQTLGEVWAVQVELGITIVCDTIPLYFFIWQHIKNLSYASEKQDSTNLKDNLEAWQQYRGASEHSGAAIVELEGQITTPTASLNSLD